MSTSQFKAFMKCPAAIMAEINGEIKPENKDSYTEGHMFEAIVSGNEELFYMQHPEIISSQGKTKGNVKSNYQKVVNAAESFNRQRIFCDIVKRCKKQVLVTGVISGVKFRGLLDLYDPETGEIFDTKCMKDFKDTYSADEGRRVSWWEHGDIIIRLQYIANWPAKRLGKQQHFHCLQRQRRMYLMLRGSNLIMDTCVTFWTSLKRPLRCIRQ